MKVSKKLAIVAGTTAVAMAGAGVGFAFFSGGAGTGTGTASTVSTTDHTITPSASESGLTYDGSTSPVTVTLSNADKYTQTVGKVTVTINTTDASWPATNCPTDSFSLGGSLAAGPYTVPAGDGTTAGTKTLTGLNIKFNDESGSNQDNCIGFTVPLTVVAGNAT